MYIYILKKLNKFKINSSPNFTNPNIQSVSNYIYLTTVQCLKIIYTHHVLGSKEDKVYQVLPSLNQPINIYETTHGTK